MGELPASPQSTKLPLGERVKSAVAGFQDRFRPTPTPVETLPANPIEEVRTPSAETLAMGSEFVRARIEGDELVKSVTARLTNEQQLAVEADKHGQTLETQKGKGLEAVSEARVVLKSIAGKRLSSREQEILKGIRETQPTIDLNKLLTEADEARNAQEQVMRAQAEARGALPTVSYTREQRMIEAIEGLQTEYVAAAFEIRNVLAEAIAQPSGLSTSALSEATAFGRTFARADNGAQLRLKDLVDHLATRFPDQAEGLRAKLNEFREKESAEKAVSIPERPKLEAAQIAQRANELVDRFGLARETTRTEVLTTLGVTFVTGENGERVPQITEGSLAEKLFHSQDYAATLQEALKATVETLDGQPLKAAGALELAHFASQEGNQAGILNTQIEEIRIVSTAAEKAKIELELAEAGKDMRAAAGALARREWVNKAYHTVVEGVKTRTATVTRLVDEARAKVTRWRTAVQEKYIAVPPAQAHVQELETRMKALQEELDAATRAAGGA